MFKQLKNLRLQFMVIALSLAVITTVLGLSAYITQQGSYSAYFKTAAGSELGFSITGKPFDEQNKKTVTPGDEIIINAAAVVEGSTPLYLFIEVDTPAYCAQDGFNSEQWHPVPGKTNVYYYGSSSQLYPLDLETGGSANILSKLILNDDAEKDTEFTFTITGYAIQQKNLEHLKDQPAEVFSLVVPASSTQSTTEGDEGGT
jgi:hypothetical protein